MNRLRFPLLAAVLLIAPARTAWSAPIPAARSGLEQVPDTAPLVIHVKGIQGVHDRLVALMNNALPDVLNKYKAQIDGFFESGPDNALKGRKLRGLNKDGPIFLLFTELPKPTDSGVPKVAILLAVSDYKEFRKNILTEDEGKNVKDEGNGIESANMENTQTYFVDRKGYAVVTPDKDVADMFTKKITGLHSKLNKDQTAKLLASDFGIYVNMEAVNKEYGEQIKQAKQGIEQVLAFAAAADESQRKLTERFKKALDPIFQTIEDMHTLTATFELRPGGLALNLHSDMKESSVTANLLQDARPVAFPELERLPRDRSYYLGIKTSAALYENLGSLISGIPSAETKDSAELIKELTNALPNKLLSSGSFPLSGLDVHHYDDPNKAVAALLKMYSNMDPAANSLKSKPVVKKNAEKYGEFQLHSVQMSLDFDKMAEQAAAKGGDDAKKQLIEAMKGLLGEKRTVWFGTDGKTLVSVTAPDWAAASKLLDQYSKGNDSAGEVKAFQDARKEMPKQTSFLGLIDVVNVFGSVFETLKPMIPAGQLPAGWPNLAAKGPSAYIGLALTLQPNRGSFDLFLTADAIQEFYKTVIKPLAGE